METSGISHGARLLALTLPQAQSNVPVWGSGLSSCYVEQARLQGAQTCTKLLTHRCALRGDFYLFIFPNNAGAWLQG